MTPYRGRDRDSENAEPSDDTSLDDGETRNRVPFVIPSSINATLPSSDASIVAISKGLSIAENSHPRDDGAGAIGQR